MKLLFILHRLQLGVNDEYVAFDHCFSFAWHIIT